jgi:hypothetical protein
MFLHRSETWVKERRNINKNEAENIKILRSTKVDKIKPEDMHMDLYMYLLLGASLHIHSNHIIQY